MQPVMRSRDAGFSAAVSRAVPALLLLIQFLGTCLAADAPPCPAGRGRPIGAPVEQCNLCPPGTWSDARQAACQACPRGTFSPNAGAISSADCSCLPGYVRQTSSSSSSAGAQQQCVPVCAEDTFLDPASLTCVACPEGTTSSAGAVGRAACRSSSVATASSSKTGTLCKLGFGQRPGKPAGTCSKCAAGYYSPGGVGAKCKRCPSHTRADAGAGVCRCAAGYVRSQGQSCTRCPRATYSDSDGITCIPCGAFLDSPSGSPDISFCECAAGFGTTDSVQDSCVACPVGSYSPGLLKVRANSIAGEAAAASSLLGPKYTPCIACGDNLTTKLTQAISRDECISTAGAETQTCGLSKTVAITCVVDSLNEIFDIGFQNEDGFLRMTCAFPARPDVVIQRRYLPDGDSIQRVQACYNRDGIVRAEFVGKQDTIVCGKRKIPDAALTCVEFGQADGPWMVGMKGFCSPETRALIGVQEICFQPGITSLGALVAKGNNA